MEVMYLALFFIIGACMGSFYTVVGLRIPRNESFLLSRSRCDECKHQLSFIDMIPIVSFILQRGRCRYCKSKIDKTSTYVEFFTGILFMVSYYSYGFSYDLLIALGIISLLMIVLVSDLIYLIIPDKVLIFFSIYFITIQLIKEGLIFTISHIFVGVFLFLVMYLIMFFGNKAFKKESMGGGDVKLMFLFGLVLDPLIGTLTIFLASLFALPMSVLLFVSNKEKVIPFGPFLLISFLFMYFAKIDSTSIINWLGFYF